VISREYFPFNADYREKGTVMRHDITQNISFPNINNQISKCSSDLKMVSAATNAQKWQYNLLLIQIILSLL
jgi:hypothetical protein